MKYYSIKVHKKIYKTNLMIIICPNQQKKENVNHCVIEIAEII